MKLPYLTISYDRASQTYQGIYSARPHSPLHSRDSYRIIHSRDFTIFEEILRIATAGELPSQAEWEAAQPSPQSPSPQSPAQLIEDYLQAGGEITKVPPKYKRPAKLLSSEELDEILASI